LQWRGGDFMGLGLRKRCGWHNRIKFAGRLADAMGMQWDAMGNARPSPPPKTNAERQAAFRERNPDYYKLIQRRNRARLKAHRLELQRREAAAKVLKRALLALPAPVERIEIPGMNAIPAAGELEAMREAVAVPVPVAVGVAERAKPMAA
jgi:hypothetical protein